MYLSFQELSGTSKVLYLQVKFVLEIMSMSSSKFKDHELKLILFALIKVGADELSDCTLLREISKALNNVSLIYLCLPLIYCCSINQ